MNINLIIHCQNQKLVMRKRSGSLKTVFDLQQLNNELPKHPEIAPSILGCFDVFRHRSVNGCC